MMTTPFSRTKKLAALLRKPQSAYVVLFLVMLFFHLQFRYVPGDEVFYGSIMDGPLDFAVLPAFWVRHYYEWSSRMLVETLFCVFCELPVLVWRLLQPMVITLTVWLIAYGLRLEQDAAASWGICLGAYLYQWHYLSDTGWIITSLAYLWPLAFALVGLYPLFRALRGETLPAAGLCLCGVALLVGANMEQTALILPFFLCGGMAVLRFGRAQKVPLWLWGYLALVLASLVFILTCPGNRYRSEEMIASFYIDYPMVTLLQKVEIGITSAITEHVFGGSIVFLLFALLTSLAVWQQKAPLLARLVSVLPALIMVPFSVLKYVLAPYFPSLVEWTAPLFTASSAITLVNLGMPRVYVLLMADYGIFFLVLLNVFAAFGFSFDTLLIYFLLAMGGMSQAALAFTPAIGVSSRRTAFFFSFCILAAGAAVWRALGEKKLSPPLKAVWLAAGGLLSIFQYIVLIEC